MSSISRTYSFTDGTDAYGSQVESEISNIVTTWNLHDAGTSAWTVVNSAAYKRSGTTILSVTQIVYGSSVLATSGSTIIPEDDTIPQNTEGIEMLTASITPVSATSKLTFYVNVPVGVSATGTVIVALFQDSTANSLACAFNRVSAGTGTTIPLVYQMTSGTTSATTFKIRAGNSNAGNIFLNSGNGTGREFGGVSVAPLVIIETV